MRNKKEKNNAIYYLGYYDIEENSKELRYYSPAARDKMSYIIKVLHENDYYVNIISASVTKGKHSVGKKKIYLNDKVILNLFSSIGKKNILFKIIDIYLSRLKVFFFLIANLKEDDILIVYHSLNYASIIKLAKKIKNFNIVLEMEELYSDISRRKVDKHKEISLSKKADAFIFPTKELNDLINVNSKPCALVHGSYILPSYRGNKFKDNRIHIVYAGTLDPRKGGAKMAVNLASKLPNKYHIHILGFGSKKQIEDLKHNICEMYNSEYAILTYDGLLSGNEYTEFMQSCDIGLSTQNPYAEYNDSSFPSKILSYLANGLHVVSAKINVVENSLIGDLVIYYEFQNPENIAKTIENININTEYDSRRRIRELDQIFKYEIKNMIMQIMRSK